MADLNFKRPVPHEQEDTHVVAHNTRIGLVLFAVYVVFYGGFMALSAFRPDKMSEPVIGGVNLAVIYGFALIIAAVALALVYMKSCRKTK